MNACGNSPPINIKSEWINLRVDNTKTIKRLICVFPI